ncbi:MAG: hypothetical protein DHS80DRAFT_24804 [Piptocephalis tieghemiana]|nr:MAG: hypothetical protein DHS80DRAFT_24804 [Piptocephalis tieghemiana]
MSSKLLDVSLDEAIKQNRSSRQKSTKPSRSSQANRRRGPRGPSSHRASPYTTSRRATESQWRHDLYEGASPTSRQGSRVVVTVGPDGKSSAVLQPSDELDEGFVGRTQREKRERERRKPGSVVHIQNLHYNVTEKDLEELMSELGPLTRVQLLYDHADRSTGKANVGFERVEDGYRAVERYHNMTLDGQRMVLSIAESTLNVNRPPSSFPSRRPFDHRQSGPSISSRINRSMRGVRGGGDEGGGGGRGRRDRGSRDPSRKESEPKPTLEELNAQMDDYMQVDE